MPPDVLLSLALAVGSSLDPAEEARAVTAALVDALALDGAAVWLDGDDAPLHREGAASPLDADAREAARAEAVVRGGAAALPLPGVGVLALHRAAPLPEAEVAALRDVAAAFARSLGHALAHRRLAEEAAESAEDAAARHLTTERLAALIRTSPAAVLVESADRRVTLANQAFCDLFGVPAPPEALVGADCAEAAEQSAPLFADPAGFVGRVGALLAARETVTAETLEMADGRVLERDYVPITVDGDYAGHLWEYRDVTERRRKAREVERLRRFYEAVLESMPAQLAVFDPDGRYRYVTPSAIRDPAVREAVVGRTDEEYAVMRGLPAEVPRRRMETIRAVAETQEAVQFEESFRTRDGEMRHFVRFVTPVVDAAGETVQVLGYGLDITDRKAAEEALAAGEALKRGVFETALDAIITIDTAGRIVEFNPAAEATFGHRAADVIGEVMADLIVPERLRDAHRAGMERYLATGAGPVLGTRIEVPALRADGSEFPCELAINPVRLDDDREVFTATLRDITEQTAAQDAIAESEARYKQIVEHSQELIYRADLAGRFTFANAVAVHRTGFAEADLLGMPFWELVDEAHRGDVVAFYARQVADGVANTYLEFPIVTAAGETVWIGQNVQLLEEDGAPVGVQAVARDVTERRRVMDELVAARETAERASRAREEFLANMSHEMRTPLNAVLGMGELLRETPLDAEQRQFLDALAYSADQLLALINDLLDLAKIDSGQILFERVPFALGEVLDGVTETVRFRAEDKGLALAVEVGAGVPEMLIGDPVRLTQILLNLLSNAVKFTERGRVHLAAERAGDADGPGRVTLRFAVEDTGVGIAEETLAAIFQRFTQARSDTTRRFGGTGLGLAIVKELTERQGGTVEVASTEGRGSTFAVTLPFAVAAEAPDAPTGDDAADLSGVRVLLVEDNALNQFVARRMLESWGATVEVAENGREGVEAVAAAAAADRPFGLVLMDIQMPEMDGFEATRRIRAAHPPEALPILALTASALVEQQGQMEEAGMDGLVLKPFKPAHLRRTIAAHLGRAAPPDRPDAPPDAPLVDLARLDASVADDPAFVAHLVDLFADVVPAAVRAMETALATDDGPGLSAAAHKLKSSAGILGIDALHARLGEVERLADAGQRALLPAAVEAAVATAAAAVDELARLRPPVPPDP